ncbi:hypothetical protein [Buttiauxella sp. S04-F03]|uniref:hypothetical protein n=1 Tax=Buttiauxella sp. S04-F03 TaxID=2904525 RepID=UPI001E54D8F8|nr:hypothetical protein [Buttiauxella sp. S04-F03]MCE0812476.1 hypothetical protein [Buttiauxella sp. S04-F03]
MKFSSPTDCDVVLYWVDSEDPEWLNEYTKYKKSPPNRFRDLGVLKYVFRSIEYNMPWIRNIHFITNGQIPEWLNLSSPKLKFHTHDDIFYFKEALPVFNSSAIEANFSNIPGLAEQFILFNDDTLVLNPVDITRFFIEYKPVDYIKLSYPRKGKLYEKIKPQNALACKFINNAYAYLDTKKVRELKIKTLFNTNYNWRTNISNLFWYCAGDIKWIDIYHHPQPHLKKTWIDFYNTQKYGVIKDTCYAKFRSGKDINQYVYRFINLVRGNFYPMEFNDHKSVYINDVEKFKFLYEKIISGITFLCFCEDENISDSDFSNLKGFLINRLEAHFEKKSSYEK